VHLPSIRRAGAGRLLFALDPRMDMLGQDPMAMAKGAWESATEPYQLSRSSRRGPVQEPFRRYGDSIAWVDLSDWCIIKKLETLKPKSGASTQLLSFLKSIADEFGVLITGNAICYEPTCELAAKSPLSQEQLEEWYAKQGFVVRKDAQGCPHIWYPRVPGV
jgi:hypothetical protein